MRRYAIYFAPTPDEPLARFAHGWLGRDPESGETYRQPAIPDISAKRLDEITADPRHYGFHGTLKAPFPLVSGKTEDDLVAAVSVFAAGWRAFRVDGLTLKAIGRFLALVPSEASPALEDLAADCVRTFDRFRALASADELTRRRAAGLSPRQDEYLMRWGYPYVLEEFRFHLTLTGSLDEPEHSVVKRKLEELTASFCALPLVIRDLAIFTQDDRAVPFRVLARLPLAGA